MKHLLVGVTVLVTAAILAGCPVYSDNGNYRVCNSTGCFDCPDKTESGACVPWPCQTSADCGGESVCGDDGTCGPTVGSGAGSSHACALPGDCPEYSACGLDGTCHVGDCGGSIGCVAGFVCKVEFGGAFCVPSTTPITDAAAPGADAALAMDGGKSMDAGPGTDAESAPPVDSGSSMDARDAFFADAGVLPVDGGIGAIDVFSPSDASGTDADAAEVTTCNADGACAAVGAGAKCIGGQCSAQSQLCSDATQCVVAEESCVDGRCTPQCSANAPCPAGFGCDFTLHVCSDNPRICLASSDCQGGTVCVEGHCAAPCAVADSEPACPAGQECVNAGCIPNERASFSCFNDGQQGALANRCDASQICVHGDCYTGCDTTNDANTCGSGTVCKEVTVAKGTFAVCGSSTTLGSACDPAAGRYCASTAKCVDGYCL